VTGYPSNPAYPAYPAGTLNQPPGPPPVQVAVAEAAPQRRATVGFRLVLVFPHFFLLVFLAIAAFAVAFAGWLGALFTGRLPEFAVNYLAGYIRWYLRAMAYTYLLTDAYPPFTLDEAAAYPVRFAVPEPQRLNRAAVFFRFILAIPAWILSAVVLEGAGSIVAFIAWLVTLAGGQLPDALHQSLTAVLRYQTRFYCYYWMLTPAYPGSLFGDPAGAAAPAGGYGSAPGYASPGYGTRASVYGPPAGYGTPGGYGPGHTVFEPASWQLVLTSGAKRLVVLFIVLGSLSYVVNGVLFAASAGRALQRARDITTANNAIDTLNGSYGPLMSKMNQWQDTASACDQNLTCLTRADGVAATYFSAFASAVRSTPMPPNATAAASQVYSDATRVAQEYTQLSQAANVGQYQATFERIGLQQTLNRFDQDFTALGAALVST
jgi:Domain of unknown function (DUF4389)